MLIEKTPYEIGKDFKVYLNGVLEAHGFRDTESALKAVHVLEGSVKGDFYTQTGGAVLLNRPLEKKE